MTFKFDFSPTVAGGGGGKGGGAGDAGEEGEGVGPLPTPVAALAATSTATAREDGSPPSPPTVVVIARMMDRCAASAGACRIIEASPPPPLPPTTPSSPRRPARDVVVDLSGGGGDDTTMGGLRCVVVDDDGPARPDLRAVDDSDLIPGVYEGGLKVWECSIDLCRHLASVVVVVGADDRGGEGGGDPAPPSIVGAAVARAIGPEGSTLELGCGHGLPGCLILREGARRVCDEDDVVRGRDGGDVAPPIVVFSDFNDFVLRRATIPNAFLNVARGQGRRRRQTTAGDRPTWAFDDDDDDEAGREGGMSARWALLRERSIFVAGDWMGLSHMLSSGRVVVFPLPSAAPSSRKTTDNDDCGDHGRRSGRRRREGEARAASDRFDLILASETTYTTDSCLDTAFLMLRHLRVDVGVGLVATKRFYFGVGGGTDAFISACEALSSSSTARGGGDDADRDGEASRVADLHLCVRVARSYDTGNANIRDLLEVTCRGK